MKNAHFVMVVAVGLGACSDSPVSPRGPAVDAVSDPNLAAFVLTFNEVVPIDITTFVPCANGGAGEFVRAVGRLHQVFTTVINSNGTVTVRSHNQPQGLTGIGLTTGDKYQATGVTQTTDQVGAPFPAVSTFINNFRFIGRGPNNNLLIHEEGHLTINANGVLTVFVDHISEECR
jgi:hypothetical protein